MSAQKSRNPEVDFGFHIVLPRILRTDYKNLTIAQKWLYTCLKDLCGEKGTCYRSLRVLSEETGISTGMLSESIPVLQKAGLIHAEKKKRSQGGKEVWHITIVDVWALNAKKHPTKRSQNEQTQDVHRMNVHTVNQVPQECSVSERECSHSETEVITVSNNSNEAITRENALSSLDETRTLSRPLVFHPLHDFIALDDAIAPKEIVVFMTPEKYFSEYEDKRRGHIADEVKYELEQRGHHVTFKWEQEDPASYKFAAPVVDATNSPSSITSEETHPQAPSFEQRDTSAPLTPPSGVIADALPEIEAEAQKTHVLPTAPAGEQSTKQESDVSHSQSPAPSQQDRAKQAPSEQPTQPELIERPKKPVMPPESMKWCPEKMLLVTEVLRGKYFTEKQKKNERKAAEKIFAAEDRTELDYVEAFSDRNDSWWRRENGLLNVSDMAAVPKDKSDMRIVLIWEKLDLRKEMESQKQGNLKDQKDNLQRKNIVDTGSRVLVPPHLTREQLKLTEQEAV